MSSDREVARDYANVFHDITLLGNKIRNRLVSWNNMFMSVASRRESMREAKRLLPSLKEALDTNKPKLCRTVNSVQKDAFLDRRLNTEAFLLSLEEND